MDEVRFSSLIVEEIVKALAFLVRKHGFTGPEIETIFPERSVGYRSPTFALTVIYEYGGWPRFHYDWKTTLGTWHQGYLEKLISDRAPKMTPPGPASRSLEEMRVWIQFYARAFQTVCADILAGECKSVARRSRTKGKRR